MALAFRRGLEPAVVVALGGVAALHVLTSAVLWGHASARPEIVSALNPAWSPTMRSVAAAWALASVWAFVFLGWRAARRGA